MSEATQTLEMQELIWSGPKTSGFNIGKIHLVSQTVWKDPQLPTCLKIIFGEF
jgi:hypothetical protein